jgi:hypothetical protein
MTPIFIGQIISFFQTALTWLVALAVPVVALMATYHAIMRSTAQDEHTAMAHSKSLKNTIIYGVMAILAGGITSTILGMFK